MKRLQKFRPAFWEHGQTRDSQPYSAFNFQRKWKLIVLLTSFMALLPLFVMTLVEFSLTRRIIENEMNSSMAAILNSAAASLSFSIKKGNSLDQTVVFDTIEVIDTYVSLTATGADNDFFVIDKTGVLITPSYYYGDSGTLFSSHSMVMKNKSGIHKIISPKGIPLIAGYAKVEDTPFVVLMIKSEAWLTSLYFKPRVKLAGYLVVSIVLIILSIMGMATYLVGRIHAADQKRVEAVHHAEYANKLASIGRLASGVAHEINNPLAIINQKAGLIMDLFTLQKEFSADKRLMGLIKDILDAVNRCGVITRGLLNFARHMEPSIQPVDIEKVIAQVLTFLEKEADRRGIAIVVDIQKSIPGFESDRGSLQQIFLNLFENAFAAMTDGGELKITVRFTNADKVSIMVSDNGVGISEEAIGKIFEPFYSSKDDHWGKGHGLSITYGLVKEIGGDIRVKSKLGKGACFTLTLPLAPGEKEDPLEPPV